VREFEPSVVVLDPVSSLMQAGNRGDAHSVLIRLIDFLKQQQITALFTNLTAGGEALETTNVAISSIVDTWLFVRDIELGGERNRAMYVLKSRGMSHSNQLREFLLTRHGVELLDVYVGPDGVLTGSSRLSREAREQAATLLRREEEQRRERDRRRKREVLEAKIEALRKEFEVEEVEEVTLRDQATSREKLHKEDREAAAKRRKADVAGNIQAARGRRRAS
jgi:circadian clock protein KaiC